MTKAELSQLYYLNREIETEQRRIAELETKATNISAKVSGMPGGSGISDKTAIAAEIADCKAIVQAKAEQCIHEYNRLCRYIAGVDDSFIRQILQYRYIAGLSWTQVAMRIGGGNTPDGVRMAHDRFLRRQY